MIRPCLAATTLALLTTTAFAEPKLDDASKLDCDWATCTLVTVTDAAKAAIEGRKEYQKLVIQFSRDSSDADLATVAKLPWVTKLYLADHITELAPLAKLVHLEEIVMPRADPKSLAPVVKLPELRRLAVSEKVSLAPLKTMTQLRDLSVSCNAAACIALIGEMSWLTTLSIDSFYTPLDKTVLAPLAKLEGLEQLMLAHTALTDLGLLAKMPKLRKLNLQANAKLVDIDALRKLPALEELTIQNGNGVRKTKVLFELENLKTLFAEDTLLSDKDKTRLKAKRPELSVF